MNDEYRTGRRLPPVRQSAMSSAFADLLEAYGATPYLIATLRKMTATSEMSSDLPRARSALTEHSLPVESDRPAAGSHPEVRRQLVESASVRSIGWSDGTLEVEYSDGDVYQYFDVPEATYLALLAGQETGVHLNLRSYYEFNKI